MASAAEAERLRKENADLQAQVGAAGGAGGDVITNAPTSIQNQKSFHTGPINTMPDPIIAALAMTP